MSLNALHPTSGTNAFERFSRLPETLYDYSLSDGAFKLYTILNRYCWTTNQCWVGREELAHQMRRSVRQIIRLLQELEQEGLIEITAPSGNRMTNTYTLMLWIPPKTTRIEPEKPELAQTRHSYGGVNDSVGQSKSRGAVKFAPDNVIKIPNRSKPETKVVVSPELDKSDTPEVTKPAAKAVTALSPKTHDHESNKPKHTNILADGVCVKELEPELKTTTTKGDEQITKVLIDTGISNQVIPRATGLLTDHQRTLADVERLIQSVKENSRIQNPAAYILKMIELDIYPAKGNNLANCADAPPTYPFSSFKVGFDDNPTAIETRIKNLRERNALTPEREQELTAKLVWAREYGQIGGQKGGYASC
jgi:Helix-turn-helix domain